MTLTNNQMWNTHHCMMPISYVIIHFAAFYSIKPYTSPFVCSQLQRTGNPKNNVFTIRVRIRRNHKYRTFRTRWWRCTCAHIYRTHIQLCGFAFGVAHSGAGAMMTMPATTTTTATSMLLGWLTVYSVCLLWCALFACRHSIQLRLCGRTYSIQHTNAHTRTRTRAYVAEPRARSRPPDGGKRRSIITTELCARARLRVRLISHTHTHWSAQHAHTPGRGGCALAIV